MSLSASAVHLSLPLTIIPFPFSHHLLTFQLISLLQNSLIPAALWHNYKLLILPPFLYPSKPQALVPFLSSSDSIAHHYRSLTLSSHLPLSHSTTLTWQPARSLNPMDHTLQTHVCTASMSYCLTKKTPILIPHHPQVLCSLY